MKIGILLIAYKLEKQVLRLVQELSVDFNVYVHFDVAFDVEVGDFEIDNVIVLPERLRCYWGSDATQRAVLELLECAFTDGVDYFVMLSGQDLPIKSNAYIKYFFEENNKNFVEHFPLPDPRWNNGGGVDRLSLLWEQKRVMGDRGYYIGKAIRILLFVIRVTQKKLRLVRKFEFTPYGGSLWFNLRRDAVADILSFVKSNPGYLERFRYTRCGDEIFFNSIIMRPGANKKELIVNDDLREIDWVSGPGFPRVYCGSDIGGFAKSDALFSRKFDSEKHPQIVSRIWEYRNDWKKFKL